MEFQVTIELEGDASALTAVGYTEELPVEWSFAEQTASTPAAITPDAGDTGELFWVWIAVPSFPVIINYRAALPGDETGPVDVSGYASYRTGGPQLESNTAATTIQLEPAAILYVDQTLSGDGLAPGGRHYTPGSSLVVDIEVTKSGPGVLTAVALESTLPTDWTFGEQLGISSAAAVSPSEGDSGTLTWLWFAVPSFPVTISFNLNIPADASGEACIKGQALFRTDGPQLYSDPVLDCLDLLPCVTLRRDIPSEVYIAGQTLAVELMVENECAESVTALAIEETLPDGWEYTGSATGDDVPDFEPSTGDTGTLQFIWMAVPTFPAEFTYTVSVPDEETGDRSISGEAPYRLGGPQLWSLVETTTVSRADVTAPVLTLLGGNPMTLECGGAFTDPGAEAIDNVDGDLSGDIVASGSVDASTPDTYILTYTVSDAAGNEAFEERTVIVEDTTPPALDLVGDATVNVECGGAFDEPGVTAVDACDGDLTGSIVVGGDTVDTNTPGEYTVVYNVSDSAGNAAPSVTRDVIVADTQTPVMTLLGGNPMTLECGGAFTDPGAEAIDNVDGDLSGDIVASGSVDASTPDTYILTYTVSDAAGNEAFEERTVIVEDTTPPALDLVGDATVNVECGGAFDEPGVTAVDACDGDLTGSIVVGGDTVNTSVPGTYEVAYTATDSAGNEGTAVRTVTVVDTGAPVLTLLGDNPMTLECGGAFTDPGAEAIDNVDGDLSGDIVVSGSVDATTPGDYALTYTVQDAEGNEASEQRTVAVEDTEPPVVTLNGEVAMTLECGAEYADPGATAADACDGALTPAAGGDTVNTSFPGTYVVTYAVTDSAGNMGAAERTIEVLGPCDGESLGTLAGQVYDQNSGNPVVCAVVELAGPQDRMAVVGINGEYVLMDLIPGDYTVRVVVPGGRVSAGAVAIAAGETTGKDIAVQPGGGSELAITGIITQKSTGVPLGGVVVDALQGGTVAASTISCASGRYGFSFSELGLAKGELVFRFAAVDYETEERTVDLTPDGGIVDVEMTPKVVLPTSLGGTVTAGGSPVVDAQVTATRLDVSLTAFTGEHGDYYLPQVEEATYDLQASAAGYATKQAMVAVAAGGTTWDVDLGQSSPSGCGCNSAKDAKKSILDFLGDLLLFGAALGVLFWARNTMSPS